MSRLDFNSPEFNKNKKQTNQSFEVDANSLLKNIMKKVNIKVVGALAVYFIVFGLVSNIWLMFSETKIYFSSLAFIALMIGVIALFTKLKNKQDGKLTKRAK